MSLEPDDVRTIARLARLRVGDDELDGIARDLSGVLALAEGLMEIDVDGVEPMAHPAGTELRLRDDEVTERDARAVLQAVAPEVRDGWFLVPRVFE